MPKYQQQFSQTQAHNGLMQGPDSRSGVANDEGLGMYMRGKFCNCVCNHFHCFTICLQYRKWEE
jgi:hypothetical protein